MNIEELNTKIIRLESQFYKMTDPIKKANKMMQILKLESLYYSI